MAMLLCLWGETARVVNTMGRSWWQHCCVWGVLCCRGETAWVVNTMGRSWWQHCCVWGVLCCRGETARVVNTMGRSWWQHCCVWGVLCCREVLPEELFFSFFFLKRLHLIAAVTLSGTSWWNQWTLPSCKLYMVVGPNPSMATITSPPKVQQA